MSLAIVFSRAGVGVSAPLVTVEVHIARGLPAMHIVGLPEAEVKESKYRVRCAILNALFEFPARRITINLAPADLPKEGGRFDLPIAIGILVASGQLPHSKLKTHEFIGELALSGEVRAVHGVLPIVIGTHAAKRCLIVPNENAEEAALVQSARVCSASHLLEVCAFLKNEKILKDCETPFIENESELLDLYDVKGQIHAKRALEIAASGKHSLLFTGPPGAGKTMLASRLPGILPPLMESQSLEIAAVCSISRNGFDKSDWRKPPFRAPHHSSSAAALVGGGRPPKPGEISLAHHGVLFLDELPEFARQVLESLREPLESGQVTISRAAYQMSFPAQFQLIAAMNPCPCGYSGSIKDNCRCSVEQVRRYLGKLSGPLLDRIDMQIEIQNLPLANLEKNSCETREKSAIVKLRVKKIRDIQLARQGKANAELKANEIETFCKMNTEAQQLLVHVMEKFNFSARVYHRLLKVARTLADMGEDSLILPIHVSEALSYRCLDKLKIAINT